jgi:hypothetical protein
MKRGDMNNQITEVKEQEVSIIDNSPAGMIRMAVEGKADLTQLKELLALQIQYEANEAKKAYNKAIAAFKANPPKIEKDKTVAFKETKYNHASLGNVTEKINTELSKYGLSASWKTSQTDKICVTCKITHNQGHSEETTLCANADNSGTKNAIQQIGSTITYLERYTILALTGLATYDQDDDGIASSQPVECLSTEQLNCLVDNCVFLNIDIVKFCKVLKVNKLEELPASRYIEAQNIINNKKAKVEGLKK